MTLKIRSQIKVLSPRPNMQQKEAKRLNMLHNILTLKLIFIQLSEFHYTFFLCTFISYSPRSNSKEAWI